VDERLDRRTVVFQTAADRKMVPRAVAHTQTTKAGAPGELKPETRSRKYREPHVSTLVTSSRPPSDSVSRTAARAHCTVHLHHKLSFKSQIPLR